ncbi:hypothetical protein [Corynebacterium sanguinis]|uniref:hypothetical protein n=1 Tax=Corynebacterium sanguinis TaxID=2594913 RepID=UPI0021A8F710|nr:hypothetical protein [Corynebacterium sanguinis]MCT1412989.1 hypothetical protein [Corynebacterium sanguinis]
MSPISALRKPGVTYWQQQQQGIVVQVHRAAVGSNISTAKLTFSALFGIEAGSAETRLLMMDSFSSSDCMMTGMPSQ